MWFNFHPLNGVMSHSTLDQVQRKPKKKGVKERQKQKRLKKVMSKQYLSNRKKRKLLIYRLYWRRQCWNRVWRSCHIYPLLWNFWFVFLRSLPLSGCTTLIIILRSLWQTVHLYTENVNFIVCFCLNISHGLPPPQCLLPCASTMIGTASSGILPWPVALTFTQLFQPLYWHHFLHWLTHVQ